MLTITFRALCSILILFAGLSLRAQSPTPVIFRPLAPPVTEVYYFKDAGLAALGNQHELQLWDPATKAYYGNIAVLPSSAFNCRIRLVEHIPATNSIAVVWEEYTVPGTDTVYQDFLSVFNLSTLAQERQVSRNGMEALLRLRFGTNLPTLRQPGSIYRYTYDGKAGKLYTVDRDGKIEAYADGGWQKSYDSGIPVPRLLQVDTTGRYLLVAAGRSNSVKRFHLSSGRTGNVATLIESPSCMSARYGSKELSSSVSFIAELNSLALVDSLNRVRIYDATTHTIEEHRLFQGAFPGRLLGLHTNWSDSTMFLLIEAAADCQRSLAVTSLRSMLTNHLTGGRQLRISASFYGQDFSSVRLVLNGGSEHEVNLTNLGEKTNHFVVNEADEQVRFCAKWEQGYYTVFDEGGQRLKVKVYDAIEPKSTLRYTQRLQLTPGETLAGILPGRKWWIGYTLNASRPEEGGRLRVCDSTGNTIFELATAMLMQAPFGQPQEQRLFSPDGKYLLVKEHLGNKSGVDSARIRVFSTGDFSKQFDQRIAETEGTQLYSRYSARIADTSANLYYTALNASGETWLYRYDLSKSGARPQPLQRLVVHPEAPQLPVIVRNLRLSRDEDAYLWTGSTKELYNGQQSYYQVVRSVRIGNPMETWGLNAAIFPDIENVLLCKDFVALQMSDHLQLQKWTDQGFQYFMSLVPVYNEKTAEASSLFIASRPGGQLTYYEKTGNDECISFKYEGHSYRRNYFDLAFNRPDAILEQLPGHDTTYLSLFRKAVQKRRERITNRLENFDPSLLPAINLSSTGYEGNKFRITLSLQSKQPISAIRTTINGATATKTVKIPAGKTEYRLTETLSQGENLIEITAVTEKGIEGLPFRLTQVHNKPQQKPALHALVVSVGEYREKAARLPFAVKDGRDMSRVFSALGDTMFSSVQVDTMFNQQVSEQAIQEWLKEKKAAAPDDYVLVFYSGHGLLNKARELQLATSSTVFDKSINTIGFEKLLSSMDAIPARQKLLLIDACHSGDLDRSNVAEDASQAETNNPDSTQQKATIKYKKKRNENAFEAMQQLFSFSEKGSGTVVFSAAGGMEFAFEAANLQNGYFTYALKEALVDNKATAGAPTLFLHQLVKYTTKRVSEISGGRQTPNLRISHPDVNWRVK